MQSTFRSIVGHPEHKSGEVHSCVWQLVAESPGRDQRRSHRHKYQEKLKCPRTPHQADMQDLAQPTLSSNTNRDESMRKK